ncbi:MAG: Flp pilus assembly protein CpaB [Deltaproteobacteria bacterium]|nr:Flp pilus assembly protein CpaB [Deltaproteobacteria bacterium]
MSTQKQKPRRIKRKSSTNNIVILLLIIVAIVSVTLIVKSRPQVAAATPPATVTVSDETVSIPVPVRNVAKGEKLKDVEFVSIKWPASRVSAEYVIDLELIKNSSALTSLPKYLPLPQAAISTAAQDSNAVVEGIPEGMRAITVKVDAESAVEGWARSGNYVDVIVIKNSPDVSVGLETRVIAENIRILSAGRSAASGDVGATAPQAPNTVTLLVNQEDALKIKTATSVGKLTFSLRGIGDQKPTLATDMDQRRLLGSSKPIDTKKPLIRGHAQGPDGKKYVLTESSEWLKQSEQSEQNKAN